MARWKTLGGGTLLAALLAGTAAQAVTPEEVWQDWVDYYGEMGQTVTAGAQSRAGDTLVVTDAVLASDAPDASFTITIPEIRLRDLGDGRVEVTMAPEIPMLMTSKPETGETVEMRMGLAQRDIVTIISGDAASMAYDMAGPEATIRLDGLTVDGEPVEMTASAVLTGLAQQYTMGDGEMRTGGGTFSATGLTFEAAGKDPESDGTFKMSGSLSDMQGRSDMSMPKGVDMTDGNAAFQAGFAVNGAFSYGASAMDIEVVEEAGPTRITATGEGGDFTFDISKDRLAYGATGGASVIDVSGAQIPFPLKLTTSESAMNFLMPVSRSDQPQPFEALVKLVDLTVSEEVWAMFDPAANLPRDPATLIVDLAGSARMLVDLFDPETAGASVENPVPGELHSLDVRQLELSAAGAELTGSGGFTFDNSDLSLGYPKPLGALDLKLVGGNALIDKLVSMGLLPEDQAMGARMMLGLFAVPAGDDTLTSKIEFREDGGLYANGQRLQ